MDPRVSLPADTPVRPPGALPAGINGICRKALPVSGAKAPPEKEAPFSYRRGLGRAAGIMILRQRRRECFENRCNESKSKK